MKVLVRIMKGPTVIRTRDSGSGGLCTSRLYYRSLQYIELHTIFYLLLLNFAVPVYNLCYFLEVVQKRTIK